MSGKVIAAMFAIGVPCASAATVGMMYKFVGASHEAHLGSLEAGLASGVVRSAVVLNASESVAVPFADSSAGEAPACPGGAGAQRCVVLAHASQVPLKIMGLTFWLPTDWLGGDGEDQYANFDNRMVVLASPDLGGRGHSADQGNAGSGANTSPGQGQVQTGGEAAMWDSGGLPFANDLTTQGPGWPDPTTPVLGPENPPEPPGPPTLEWRPNVPGPSYSPLTRIPTAPEPSTWAMMLAGAASLGVFKRRRILAAWRSVRG